MRTLTFAFVAIGAGTSVLSPPAVVRQDAGVRTVVDSSRDTIVVRVTGAVPALGLKRLVVDMRIAPSADDTSSFTDTSEFDVDRRGFIWVFDRSTASIFLFDSASKPVRRVGHKGAGPGEFSANGGMVALPDGRLAQWDYQNSRISFFSPAGVFLASWPLAGGFSSADNLITDATGRLYTVRPIFPKRAPGDPPWAGDPPLVLIRYRDGGALGDTLVPPRFDIPSYTYTAMTGTSASAVGTRHAPDSHWAWHPAGYFVGGDGSKYHITIGRTNAKPIRIERMAPVVPIPDAERSAEEARIVATMRNADAAWSWKGPPLPRTKAPLVAIKIARDGRIWAQVPSPSQRIPDSEIQPPRPGSHFPPAPPFRSPQVWEVYSATGAFLGRVPMPSRARLMEADGNRVWLLDRDEDDLPIIVRAHLEPPLTGR
jgi:hypothetical protein